MMKNKLYESMEIDFENGCGIVESYQDIRSCSKSLMGNTQVG